MNKGNNKSVKSGKKKKNMKSFKNKSMKSGKKKIVISGNNQFGSGIENSGIENSDNDNNKLGTSVKSGKNNNLGTNVNSATKHININSKIIDSMNFYETKETLLYKLIKNEIEKAEQKYF
jgi:hypothetical protein